MSVTISSPQRRETKGLLKINERIFRVYEGQNTIGRNRYATVALKYSSVSQQHAIITVFEDKHFLSEIKSINGTYLNDQLLVPYKLYELKDETRIRFADVEAIYHKVTETNTLNEVSHIESQTNDESILEGSTQEMQPCDLHEMPTQAIIYSPEKTKNSSSIHELPTQIFCEDVDNEVQISVADCEQSEGPNDLLNQTTNSQSSNESLNLFSAAAQNGEVEGDDDETPPQSQIQVQHLQRRVRRVISSEDEGEEVRTMVEEKREEMQVDIGGSSVEAVEQEKGEAIQVNVGDIIADSDSETDIEDALLEGIADDSKEDSAIGNQTESAKENTQDANSTISTPTKGNSTAIVAETPEIVATISKLNETKHLDDTRDESLVVPCTQDMTSFAEELENDFNTQDLRRQSQTNKNTQNSTNSMSGFSLGLTQLMANEDDSESCSEDKVEEAPGRESERVADGSKNQGLEKSSSLGPSESTLDKNEDDIYMQPTQIFVQTESTKVAEDIIDTEIESVKTDDKENSKDSSDVYLKPTQVFCKDDLNDDLFVAPTQKFVFDESAERQCKEKPEKEHCVANTVEDDIYNMATQAFTPINAEDDICLMPTQKFVSPVSCKSPENIQNVRNQLMSPQKLESPVKVYLAKSDDVESQLEVAFPTQTVKVVEVVDRPVNPLLNVLQDGSQKDENNEEFAEMNVVTDDPMEVDSSVKENCESNRGEEIVVTVPKKRRLKKDSFVNEAESSKVINGKITRSESIEENPIPFRTKSSRRINQTPENSGSHTLRSSKRIVAKKEDSSAEQTASSQQMDPDSYQQITDVNKNKRKQKGSLPSQASSLKPSETITGNDEQNGALSVPEEVIVLRTRGKASKPQENSVNVEVVEEVAVRKRNTTRRTIGEPSKNNTETVRGTRKRRNETKIEENSSDVSTTKNDNSLTPKRSKRNAKSVQEPSGSSSSCEFESPDRPKRMKKPNIAFTMMDETPTLRSTIRNLGGRIVDDIKSCTVLVTEHLKRSQKLLMAIGMCKPVCSPEWLKECRRENAFLDPWKYLLKDEEAETKWNFSLKESFNRSGNKRLLQGFTFMLLVTTALDVLKGAIEACGGKLVAKLPSKIPNNFAVIANPENKAKTEKLKKQHAGLLVIVPEAIFDGVLRQELNFDNHLLT